MKSIIFLALVVFGASLACADALDEVNHCRRTNGLPPLIRDPQLMQGAQAKAEFQAFYKAAPWNGYSGGHDGPSPPSGISEGTAHRRRGTSSWGSWASCLMATPGTHYAGAGVALDSEGHKYMCLWIRGSNLPRERIVPTAVPTSHLNPNPPMIPYSGVRLPANPGPGVWFTPRDYSRFPGPRGVRRSGVQLRTPAAQWCPKCGRYH